MPLPHAVEAKVSVYFLACRELHSKLTEVREACQEDLRYDFNTCLSFFNDVLRLFFQRSDAVTRKQASEAFCDRLRGEASSFRNTNPQLAEVFDDVALVVSNEATGWEYMQDLQKYHSIGQSLARQYLQDSPYDVTQNRLSLDCSMILDHWQTSRDDPPSALVRSFGYKPAPIAYVSENAEDVGTRSKHSLKIHFTYDFDFGLYLALPYLFLHEYSAHVYTTDSLGFGNERFSDGWMLHAAASFMKRTWVQSQEEPRISREQADAFYEQLYVNLRHIPRGACKFARIFDDWVSCHCKDAFGNMTYELAAFLPTGLEKPYWATQFLNTLERAFDHDKAALLEKIGDSSSVRELLVCLPGA